MPKARSSERHEIIDIMGELKLGGMRQAYDETMQAATQHKWRPQRLVGELLCAELAEKTARSIRYQMNAAKFPVMKTLEGFDFSASPINEELVRTLHDGTFLEAMRNAVLVGGTGTGKTHLVTAIGAKAVTGGPSSACSAIPRHAASTSRTPGCGVLQN